MVNFPLYNERRRFNSYYPIAITNETVSIPALSDSDGYYTYQLVEVPDDTSKGGSTRVIIPGFTESINSYPSKNQFRVDYQNGIIYFHASNAGQTKYANYYGLGSIVRAEEINYLNTKVKTFIGLNDTPSAHVPDAVIYTNSAGTSLASDANFAFDGSIVDVPALRVNGSYTLPTSDGSASYVLTTDGAGVVSWAAASGGGTPGGSSGQIQYNNAGSFGGLDLIDDDTFATATATNIPSAESTKAYIDSEISTVTSLIVTEFQDSTFRLYDNGDSSKELAFQLSGITASTTRTITIGDYDTTLVNYDGTNLTVPVTGGIVFGDGDSKIYESSDDKIDVNVGGTDLYRFSTTAFKSLESGNVWYLRTGGTSTAPIFTFNDDRDSGISNNGSDILYLIAGGKEMVRIVETGSATTDQIIFSPGAISGSAATPTLAFGDGDTGFYEPSDDVIRYVSGGGARIEFSGYQLYSKASGKTWNLGTAAASATTPAYRFNGDGDTGIGTNSGDELSLIAGGVEALRLVEVSGHVVIKNPINASVTASTTQTQGNGQLYSSFNNVTNVANPDDTVTLSSAVAGYEQTVMNSGANVLKIYPSSSDDLGEGVNVYTELEPGGRITFLAIDTTNWIIKDRYISRNYIDLRNRMIGYYSNTSPKAGIEFLDSRSGSGSAVLSGATTSTYGLEKYPGVYDIRCGAVNSRAGLYTFTSMVTVGRYGMDMRCGVVAKQLSNATEEFFFTIGIGDAFNSAGLGVDGLGFRYDRATDGDFYSCISLNGSSETKTVTAVVPSTTAVQKLRVVVNAAGTEAKFYIDGTLVATHTTNLPYSATTGISGFGAKIEKTASAASTNVDYFIANFDVVLLTTVF